MDQTRSGFAKQQTGISGYLARVEIDPGKWALLSAGLALAGILLRLWQYAGNRSLWIDEAMLARNIIDKGYLALLKPLDFNQAAPVIFLWLVKFSEQVFGSGELALRLMPLLASVAGVILFYYVAREYLSAPLLPPAVFIFAASQQLVFYAQEFKQYAFDVAVALALILMFMRIVRLRAIPRQVFWPLLLLGFLSTYIAHASIFTIAALSSVLVLLTFDRDYDIRISQTATLLGCWGIGFLVNYFLFLGQIRHNDFFDTFWASAFLPLPVTPAGLKEWFLAFYNFMKFIGLKPFFQALGALLAGYAVISDLRRKSPVTLLFVLMFAFTLLASVLEIYPFKRRLILFLIPLTFLLPLKGAEMLASRKLQALSLLTVLLLLVPSFESFSDSLTQITKEETRQTLDYLMQHKKEGDGVFVYNGAVHAVHYNMRGNAGEIAAWHFGERARQDNAVYLGDIEMMKRYKRAWFIFSHIYGNEDKFYLAHMNATPIDSFKLRGASLYLFDFGNSTVPSDSKPAN